MVANQNINLQQEEIRAAVWLPLQEAVEKATYPGSKKALTALGGGFVLS